MVSCMATGNDHQTHLPPCTSVERLSTSPLFQVHDIVAKALLAAEPRINTEVKMKVRFRRVPMLKKQKGGRTLSPHSLSKTETCARLFWT